MPVAVNYSFRDEHGTVHGPFSAEKMMHWYKSAFFTEELEVLIQPENEQPIPTRLKRLIAVNGKDEPFLAVSGPPPKKITVKRECGSQERETTENTPDPAPSIVKTEIPDSAEENQSVAPESESKYDTSVTEVSENEKSTRRTTRWDDNVSTSGSNVNFENRGHEWLSNSQESVRPDTHVGNAGSSNRRTTRWDGNVLISFETAPNEGSPNVSSHNIGNALMNGFQEPARLVTHVDEIGGTIRRTTRWDHNHVPTDFNTFSNESSSLSVNFQNIGNEWLDGFQGTTRLATHEELRDGSIRRTTRWDMPTDFNSIPIGSSSDVNFQSMEHRWLQQAGLLPSHNVNSLPSCSVYAQYNLPPTNTLRIALPLLGKQPKTNGFLTLQKAEFELFQLESMIRNMPETFIKGFPVTDFFRDQLCGLCGQFLEGVKNVLDHVINDDHLSKVDKMCLTEEDVNFWKARLEEIFTWGRQKTRTKSIKKAKTILEGLKARKNEDSLEHLRPLFRQPISDVAENSVGASSQPVSSSSSTGAKSGQPLFTDKFAIAKYFTRKIAHWNQFDMIAFDILSSWRDMKKCPCCQEKVKRPSVFFRHLFTQKHCENMLSDYAQEDLDEWSKLISLINDIPKQMRNLPKATRRNELFKWKKSLHNAGNLDIRYKNPKKVLRWINATPTASPEPASPAGTAEVVGQGFEMTGLSTSPGEDIIFL